MSGSDKPMSQSQIDALIASMAGGDPVEIPKEEEKPKEKSKEAQEVSLTDEELKKLLGGD